MVPEIKIPDIQLLSSQLPYPEAVIAKQKEIKEEKKGFFVAHRNGFSAAVKGLKDSMVASGRCKFIVGDKALKMDFEKDAAAEVHLESG